MFDVGFWEISLLAILGLIILGPDRLPRVVHTAGLWMGRARSAVRKLQREIQRELMIEETRAAVEKARAEVAETVNSIDPSAGSRGASPKADSHAPTGTEAVPASAAAASDDASAISVVEASDIENPGNAAKNDGQVG